MVLLPPLGMMVIKLSSSSMLLPRRLGMTEPTAERRTYVRTRGKGELWDRLQAEKLRATESPYYSNAQGNAWDMGKGDREITLREEGARNALKPTDERSVVAWKAVCAERRTYRLGRGGGKRLSNGTSPAAYSTFSRP